MRRVANNIVFLVLGQAVSVSAHLLTLTFTARYLGAHLFGQLMVLRSASALALPLLTGGLRPIMAKHIGRDPDNAASFLGTLLTLRWAIVLVLAVVTGVAVRALPLDDELRLASYAAVFLALANVWGAFPRAVFIAYERSQYHFAGNVGAAVLTFALTLLAVRLDLGVAGILVAAAVPALVFAQILMVVVYRRFVRPKLRVDLRHWGQILKESLPIGASGMLKQSYAQVDVWLLAGLSGAAAAGIFSIAYRITVQVTGTSILVGNAILPRLSLLARVARDRLRTAFEHLVIMFLVISMPAAGLVAAFAQPIVLAIAGPKFAASVEALRLVSIVLVTALPDALLFFCLVALGKEVAALTCLGGTVAINVVLDLLLIPWLGVRGACLGTITAEWVYFFLSLIQIHRVIGLVQLPRFVGKTLVAGLGMMLAVAWAGPHRPLLGAVSGLTVYLVLILLLRAIPPGALGTLRRSLREPTARAAADDALVPPAAFE